MLEVLEKPKVVPWVSSSQKEDLKEALIAAFHMVELRRECQLLLPPYSTSSTLTYTNCLSKPIRLIKMHRK